MSDTTMTDVDPQLIASYIERNCEHDPADATGDHPRELFREFDVQDDWLDENLADLWHWGLLEIEQPDDGEAEIAMTAFGVELVERGWIEKYIDAKLGIVRGESTDDRPAVNDFTTQ